MEAAHTLAKEWARRGEAWCSLWVCEEERDDFRYDERHVVEEEPAFLEWMLTLDCKSATSEQAELARNWRPRAAAAAVES